MKTMIFKNEIRKSLHFYMKTIYFVQNHVQGIKTYCLPPTDRIQDKKHQRYILFTVLNGDPPFEKCLKSQLTVKSKSCSVHGPNYE